MKTILCLIAIMFGLTAAAAQEKALSQSDFEAILKNANEILKAKPHRVVVTSKSDVNGKSQEAASSKTVVEVATDGKRHSIREYKSADKNFKREYVSYGEKTYLRENDGKWTQSAAIMSQNAVNMKPLEEKAQYEALGKETLGSQNATVYRRIKTSRMMDNSTNEEVQSTETVKYWFDENGALLKREMERENRRSGKIFHFNVVASFEYDPSIQVTAPVL